jgi:acyl-coenzyme A thioesterase PaaI-like protein
MEIPRPIQDYYPEDAAVCFGCGRNNPHGLHIQTFWDGHEGVFRFRPRPHHTAFPGVTYGGLIASLIDCHCIATAIAATYDAENRTPGEGPQICYVTGNLNVTFVRPTPIDSELVLRARVKQLLDKKAVVTCFLYAGDLKYARGKVVAVRVPSWSHLKTDNIGS